MLDGEASIGSDRAEPRPLAIVADDEAEVRQLVSEILAEVGFDTLSARDGVELVDLAEGTFAYVDDDVDEVARMWQVVHDGPFHFTDDEVVEAHFVSVDELRRRVARDPFVPDSLALVGPLLLGDVGDAGPGVVGIGE